MSLIAFAMPLLHRIKFGVRVNRTTFQVHLYKFELLTSFNKGFARFIFGMTKSWEYYKAHR